MIAIRYWQDDPELLNVREWAKEFEVQAQSYRIASTRFQLINWERFAATT